MLSMLNAYFNQIHRSVLIYADKSIYKSESQIEFVKNLLEEYRETICANEIIENMETYIKRRLHRDYIGMFRFSFIEEWTIKIKWIMACIVALHGLYTIAFDHTQIYLLLLNTTLLVGAMIITIVRGMTLRKAEIILILEDYLNSQYNLETWKNELHEQEKQLGIENEHLKDTVDAQTYTIKEQEAKIEELKLQMEAMKKNFKEVKKEEKEYPELKDKDIMKILKDINF